MTRLNIGGIIVMILLLCGIVLTLITIRRMKAGQISLPGWAKVLLSVAMILGLLYTLMLILPPKEATVDSSYDSEYTYIIAPADPGKETTAPT